MGMLLVPMLVGFIFRNEVTMAGNQIQELTAARHSEFVFISLSLFAIIVSLCYALTSDRHPEMRLDEPNGK